MRPISLQATVFRVSTFIFFGEFANILDPNFLAVFLPFMDLGQDLGTPNIKIAGKHGCSFLKYIEMWIS